MQKWLRERVERFESRYRDAKVENGSVFDAEGLTIEQRRGGKGSVRTSTSALQAGAVFSHNHPRGEGVIGGTFSPADLSNFSKFGVVTYRAAAKEGTYSISKGKNFDSEDFPKWFRNEHAKITKKYTANIGELNKRQSTMSYEDYLKEHRKESNRMLVELHDTLISGQKRFGYTYRLERSR